MSLTFASIVASDLRPIWSVAEMDIFVADIVLGVAMVLADMVCMYVCM